MQNIIDTSNDISDDKPHEECAVFGIYGMQDAAKYVYFGLHSLQHRGQEAHGVVSSDGSDFFAARHIGLVGDKRDDSINISQLLGSSAIGHNRYSTTGASELRNVQPLYADLSIGGISVAHNGNFTNAKHWRRELVNRGCIFQSTNDTETLLHLMSQAEGNLESRLIQALQQIKGAYALLFLTSDSLIGVRDPCGIRPLVLGRLDGAYILASETVAFDIIGAEFIREVEHGEMVIIDADGCRSRKIFSNLPEKARPCLFEYIYFARPDSIFDGRSVYGVRKLSGKILAEESSVEADVVVPVPDSGVPAAIGYSEHSGIPFDLGIIRNHYVGRTFIEPEAHIRDLGVRLKHNANPGVIAGKRVILVDDSLVRGTTCGKIIRMVRGAGAKEVHVRIASPPVRFPCYYGIDLPSADELLAAKSSVEEICEMIGADSLSFISLDGLYRALGEDCRDVKNPQFTDHYFSGDYPVVLEDALSKLHDFQLSLLHVVGKEG